MTDRTPSSIELHLSPGTDTFSAKFSSRVKALAGARFTECRGDRHTRFVTVPATNEGAALAVELLREYPQPSRTREGVRGTTMLGRPRFGECQHYLVDGEPERQVARALGHISGVAVRASMEAYDKQDAEARAKRAALPGKLRAEREACLARAAEISRLLTILDADTAPSAEDLKAAFFAAIETSNAAQNALIAARNAYLTAAAAEDVS